MKVLTVIERRRAWVSEEDFSLLHASPVFRAIAEKSIVSLRLSRNGCELEAGPFVGSVNIMDDVVLSVEEKTPGATESLFQLAHEGLYRLVQRDARYSIIPHRSNPRWLRRAISLAFFRRLEPYLQHGLSRRYVAEVKVSGQPRGKVLVKETLQRLVSRGIRDRVYHRVQKLSRDNALNRVLKLSLLSIAARSGKSSAGEAQQKADYYLFHFLDVRRDNRLLYDVQSNRYRRDLWLQTPPEYKELVELALVILQDELVLPKPSESVDLPFATFVSLERLFEIALYRVVEWACTRIPGASVVAGSQMKEPRYLFVDTQKMSAEPDVVVLHGEQPRLLLDAKYKDVVSAIPHDEIYQLLAHCKAFGVSEGWLVGTADDGQIRERTIGHTVDGVRVRLLAVPVRRMKEMITRLIRQTVEPSFVA